MGYLMKKGGAGVPSANRITLLRDANGDGVAESRSVLLTGLNSPYGMALMGGYLYVADTDQLLRFPFTPGQTRITAKPETVVTYPGGGNHWARNVIVAEDGKSLYLAVGSSSNIAENGLDLEKGPRQHPSGLSRHQGLSHLRRRHAQPQRHGVRAAHAAACGWRSTSATCSGPTARPII